MYHHHHLSAIGRPLVKTGLHLFGSAGSEAARIQHFPAALIRSSVHLAGAAQRCAFMYYKPIPLHRRQLQPKQRGDYLEILRLSIEEQRLYRVDPGRDHRLRGPDSPAPARHRVRVPPALHHASALSTVS